MVNEHAVVDGVNAVIDGVNAVIDGAQDPR
jgi:hypothetical protein